MAKHKDIRTLCHGCYMDMHNAGYKLKQLKKNKSRCDKCIRIGFSYELLE